FQSRTSVAWLTSWKSRRIGPTASMRPFPGCSIGLCPGDWPTRTLAAPLSRGPPPLPSGIRQRVAAARPAGSGGSGCPREGPDRPPCRPGAPRTAPEAARSSPARTARARLAPARRSAPARASVLPEWRASSASRPAGESAAAARRSGRHEPGFSLLPRWARLSHGLTECKPDIGDRRKQMPSKTQKLPVLPLTQAVVLPRMSATIPIDSEDARAAVRAALSQDGLLLLLPKVDSRYATVGVAAKIEEKGNLPDGTEVVAVVGRSCGAT